MSEEKDLLGDLAFAYRKHIAAAAILLVLFLLIFARPWFALERLRLRIEMLEVSFGVNRPAVKPALLTEVSEWSSDELKVAAGETSTSGGFSSTDLESHDAGEKAGAAIADAGKKFYASCAAYVDSQLANFEAAVSEPVPVACGGNAAEAARKSISSGILHPFGGRHARAIDSAARYLSASGRHADAVKLYLLVYKYAARVASGDGTLPTPVGHVVRCQLINLSIGSPGFFDALVKCSNDAAFLATVRERVASINAEMPPSDFILELFIRGEETFVREAVTMDAKGLMEFEKLRAKAAVSAAADDVSATISRILKSGRSPAEASRELSTARLDMDRKAAEYSSATAFFFHYDAFAARSFNAVTIDFTNTALIHAAAAMRAEAAIALCDMLIFRARTSSLPVSLAELAAAKIAVPNDPYAAEAGRACLFRATAEDITLYSVGLDGIDGGGGPGRASNGKPSDTILFKIKKDAIR